MNPKKFWHARNMLLCREMGEMEIDQTDSAPFVSIPAAARELKVSTKRLALAIELRQVPAIVLGRRKMVPRRALERLIEAAEAE